MNNYDKSICYDNKVINVRLKSGEVMRLLEVIYNDFGIQQVVVQKIPEKCVKVMRLIEANQIALPKLVLARKISKVQEKKGGIKSLYDNANYLVIED